MPIEAAINTGLGLLLEGHNDRRQLRQQEKLQDLQIEGNKELQKYGQELALDTWRKTNYDAQVEELKKAGLSTGLMYGGGGQGGTTSGGNGGAVSGANAPVGGQEILGLQLMGAQRDLIKAQTEKTNAETEKTKGVDTQLTGASARIAEIQGQMLNDTYEETFSKIMSEAEKAASEARIASQQADVGEMTLPTQVAKAQAELIGLGIANELRKAQTDLTQEQINATIESVKQKWAEVETGQGRLKLEQFVKDISDSTKLTVETIGKIVGIVTKGK